MEAQDIKRLIGANWLDILARLAPSLHEAIEVGVGSNRHVSCPIHGGKSFRFFKDAHSTGGAICSCGAYSDGFSLLQAVNGWSFHETVKEVEALIAGEKALLQPRPLIPAKSEKEIAAENKAIRNRLNAIWRHSKHISNNDIVDEYLKNRGLTVPSALKEIRHHCALAYHNDDGKFIGHYPAMIARVTGQDNRPVTLHRTYLDKGQKADVEEAKKLLSHPSDTSLRGSAIRLFPCKDVLAVAEGIETALAIHESMGVPCWATITAGLMRWFDLPEGSQVKKVLICADKDRPHKIYPNGTGQDCSAFLSERLNEKGIETQILIPQIDIPDDKKSIDWLDILNLSK